MGIKAENATGFERPDDGKYELQIETIEFKRGEGEKSGILSCTVMSKTLNSNHGNSLDINVRDFFYNINEPEDGKGKARGLKRLLYALTKIANYPVPESGVNFDHFENEAEQTKITRKLPGVIYGGDIVTKSSTKKVDGKDVVNENTNVKEYYTKAEIKELLKAGKPAAADTQTTSAAATGDGW